MSKQDHILTVEVVDQDGSTFTLREICERGECHAEFVIKLKMNLPGLAMSLELLDEVEEMRREVARLNHRIRQLMGE